MLRIYETYWKYITNSKYVYKSCHVDWIIILEKIHGTITNENRSNVVFGKYAKYRANKLKVVLIFNKFNPILTINNITNSLHKEKIHYVVGEIVETNFDSNISKVCTTGIHYFKSIESAFYLELNLKKKYTGKYIFRDSNGLILKQFMYLNGEKI